MPFQQSWRPESRFDWDHYFDWGDLLTEITIAIRADTPIPVVTI